MGALTGGREVTRTAGCHGGGDGGSGACGGTGQPASATGAEVVGTVTVVGVGRGVRCARCAAFRGDAVVGRASREGAERATRPEPFGALGAAGPDEAASAATAATTVLASTAAAVARERLIRSDEGTVHCRGPPGRMRGGPGGGSSEVPDRPRDQAIRAPLFRGARHCSCEQWPVVLDALAGAAVLVPAASSNGHSALAGEHGSP